MPGVGELGIRLVLLVGDTVPLPAPYEVTSVLERVQVTNDAQGQDGFQLTFRLERNLMGDYGLLLGGAVDPMKRVIIGVLLGAVPEVLIDGIITHRQVTPGAEPGASTLTVSGRDVSVMMDLEERIEEYPNEPDFVAAVNILSRYALYGLLPKPTPTSDFTLQVQRTPRQTTETDLAYVRRMAGRNGYVFFVEPLTFGVNTAYFGPEPRISAPQPALTLGMGAADNLTGIHFTQDGLAPVAATGTFVEPFTGQVLPIPQLPTLKLPPIVPFPAPAYRIRHTPEAPKPDAAQAARAAVAAVTNAPDAVTASGELDGARYGGVLRARRLVGVRGVGMSYSGLYYVRSVTHSLSPASGEYTQSFSLSREGTGSLLPLLPT